MFSGLQDVMIQVGFRTQVAKTSTYPVMLYAGFHFFAQRDHNPAMLPNTFWGTGLV